MNVIEAYLKFKGYHIILISGYSGSYKTIVAQSISKRFNYKYVNLSQFYLALDDYDKKENYIEYSIDNEIIHVLDWCNVYKSVNWHKFNDYVNEHKTKGIIISGFGFPKDLLQFVPDTHIYIKINKDNLINNRENYIKTNNKPFDKVKEIRNILIEEQLMTQIKKDAILTRIINSNNITTDEITYSCFKYIIDIVLLWLKNYKPIEKKLEKKYPITTAEDKIYKNFYYPNKPKNLLYDTNDQGIKYPEEFRKEYNKKYVSVSSSESRNTSSISSSDMSDRYLFTVDPNTV
jgi:hypothetical protein